MIGCVWCDTLHIILIFREHLIFILFNDKFGRSSKFKKNYVPRIRILLIFLTYTLWYTWFDHSLLLAIGNVHGPTRTYEKMYTAFKKCFMKRGVKVVNFGNVRWGTIHFVLKDKICFFFKLSYRSWICNLHTYR